MKVPIVIYDQEMNRSVIGQVDVYAASWRKMPFDTQLEVDRAVLDGRVEFVFNLIPDEVRQPSGEVQSESGTVGPGG